MCAESANSAGGRLTTPDEHARLLTAGFFNWGRGHWVHESKEGHVLTTDQALALIDSKGRYRPRGGKT